MQKKIPEIFERCKPENKVQMSKQMSKLLIMNTTISTLFLAKMTDHIDMDYFTSVGKWKNNNRDGTIIIHGFTAQLRHFNAI